MKPSRTYRLLSLANFGLSLDGLPEGKPTTTIGLALLLPNAPARLALCKADASLDKAIARNILGRSLTDPQVAQ
jgi:hypothetical protein